MIKRTNNTYALYLWQVSINCGGHGDGTAISPRGHSSESVVPVMHYHVQELLFDPVIHDFFSFKYFLSDLGPVYMEVLGPRYVR